MAMSDMLSAVMGGSAGKSDMKKALQEQQEAKQLLKNVYVPTVEEQKVLLDNPELAGLLQAEQLSQSEQAGVSVDPRLKQAQMKALEQLSGLADTGLGVQDQAAFNDLRKQAGAEASAANAATLQQAAAQGTLDSGNTLMSQLNAGQAQANRLQDAGQAQAAAAAQARRDALNSYANMSSSMSNNDFNQKSTVASAKDAINKFNSQNRQDVNASNLNTRQNIANQTAANSNTGKMHNAGLIQQQFNNNLGKAGQVAGQMNNVANTYSAQGQAAAQGQANMNGAILGIGANLATAGMASGAGAAAAPAAKAGTASGKGASYAVPGSADDYYMNKVK